VADCDDDPLFYSGRMRVASGIALLRGVERVPELLALVPEDVPVLVQHGDADRVCDVDGSRMLVNSLVLQRSNTQSSNARPDLVTLVEYPGGHHDLLREREPIASSVVKDALIWLEGVFSAEATTVDTPSV